MKRFSLLTCVVVSTFLFVGCKSTPAPDTKTSPKKIDGRDSKPSGYDKFKIPGDPKKSSGLQLEYHFTSTTVSRLIVGSWNIKWFGNGDPDKWDYVTMADFIEECDVVAIQELSGANYKQCLDNLVGEINARGHSYEYRYSEETGYDDNNNHVNRNKYKERFAFIWDSDRLDLKAGTLKLLSNTVINNSTFRQVPLLADFKSKHANGFDFRLLTTHTVYNKKLHLVRKGEIAAIKEYLKESAKPQSSERNVVAIGDFNANPPSQPKYAHHFKTIVPDGTDFRVLMYESRDAPETPIRTTVPTKDSSVTNPNYQNEPVYDHILVTLPTNDALTANPMTRMGGDMGVYEFDNDPWWKDNGWERSDIIKAVSDHRPIWFTLIYSADDDD